MIYLITTIHVIVCLVLVAVVLLQSGKAADLAGAFGGMGSQTVFGPRGSATVLSKATTISAIVFMITSLTLSIMATRGGSGTPDLIKKTLPVSGKSAPAPVPAAPAQSGGTAPITVQGGVEGGAPSAPVTVEVPVSPAPAPPVQQKK
jgi:preprotein translocase subunit SecG